MSQRESILINNLLSEICKADAIPREQYIPWLKSEVGFTDQEIEDLRNNDLFPEPVI